MRRQLPRKIDFQILIGEANESVIYDFVFASKTLKEDMENSVRSSLTIQNPKAGPISQRTYFNDRADGILSAVKDSIAPHDATLHSRSGQEILGVCYVALHDLEVKATDGDGYDSTYLIGAGEILVYARDEAKH
jgi:hypothetical protein